MKKKIKVYKDWGKIDTNMKRVEKFRKKMD